MSLPPTAPVNFSDVPAAGAFRRDTEPHLIGTALVPPAAVLKARELTVAPGTESTLMRQLGIAQEGDPLLREVAEPFDLPRAATEAADVVEELLERVSTIREVHTFSKGTGLAAPQIGIPRRAAVVFGPDADVPIVLLNPVVFEVSAELDEPKYEGCLSFFDARGRLARPLSIRVAHQDFDGAPLVSTFTRSTARLVAHEVDHLDGILYVDRMAPDEEPISVLDYRGTGTSWDY